MGHSITWCRYYQEQFGSTTLITYFKTMTILWRSLLLYQRNDGLHQHHLSHLQLPLVHLTVMWQILIFVQSSQIPHPVLILQFLNLNLSSQVNPHQSRDLYAVVYNVTGNRQNNITRFSPDNKDMVRGRGRDVVNKNNVNNINFVNIPCF